MDLSWDIRLDCYKRRTKIKTKEQILKGCGKKYILDNGFEKECNGKKWKDDEGYNFCPQCQAELNQVNGFLELIEKHQDRYIEQHKEQAEWSHIHKIGVLEELKKQVEG